jgi:hypothetical protein
MLNNIISLDDFSLIKENYNFFNTELLTEAANLSDEWDKDIKFGIIMATHRIDKGIKARVNTTPKVLKDSLDSIFKQTHDKFKVFLVADAYPEEHIDEIQKIVDSYPKEKLWFKNLDKPGERDTPASKKKFPGDSRYGISSYLHACGGVTCWNTAVNQMRSEGFKYACKLDHDDKWKPDHLETHAKGYTQFPDATFIASRATKKKMSERSSGSDNTMYIPESDSIKDIDYDNVKMNHLKPFSGSAISWKLDKFGACKFRDWQAQTTTSPRRSEVLHGDSDWYKQVIDKMQKQNLKMLYIPKITNPLRNSDGKF